MKIYIAGPMTGIPDLNYPAFHAAAKQLRDLGHDVASPAEDIADGLTWAEYMRSGLTRMLTCDAVAVLDGWANSKGAAIEVELAKALSIHVSPIQKIIESKSARFAVESAGQEWFRIVDQVTKKPFGCGDVRKDRAEVIAAELNALIPMHRCPVKSARTRA